MLILIHVMIALLGLVQASYGLIVPSKGKLRVTYALTTATFVSGSYLVWHLHAPVLQSCLSGLTYLGVILAATFATQYRMHRATERQSI
jgi:hypothetical protein